MAAFPSYIVQLQGSPDGLGCAGDASSTNERNVEAETSYSQSALTLNASMSAKRGTLVPRCMTKAQQNALASLTAASPHRRTTTRTTSGPGLNPTTPLDHPEPRDRALQMLFTYPIMKVANTAFENGLRVSHRGGGGGANPLTRLHDMHAGAENWSINNASLTFDAATLNNSMVMEMSTFLDMSLTLRNTVGGGTEDEGGIIASNRSRGENVVRTATALKRGMMWQVVLVTALGHGMWLRRFRVERLCRILRLHLLPVLLRRRDETGSVLPAQLPHEGEERRGSAEGAAELQQIHGIYLKEHHSFLAELNNTAFLQMLVETMRRQRFMPGEVVARADMPSQQRLYFLVSGKCEFAPEHGAHDASTAPLPETCVRPARARRQLLLSGDCFGGIFRADTVFDGTYKALTQCIVWILEAEDFERVFRLFADEKMLASYTAAFRALHLERLQRCYPIPAVLPRVPVYRLLERAAERYADDFTPVVKVRGEVLFEQGENVTGLYCLVEGSVLRSVRGRDGSYASQLLTTNGFANFHIRTRFVLLGEEPFLLPCQARYRCTVQSRAALLLAIPGDRFVSALLDDPTLYVALREKLTEQIRSSMRLDPVCLTHAPLLRPFPEAALQALAAAAEPRLVHRGVALCEPVRPIHEIYLVVRGEVRDGRHHRRSPTPPLPTPAPTEHEDTDDDDNRVRGGGVASRVAPFAHGGKETHRVVAAAHVGEAGAAKTRGHGRGRTRRVSVPDVETEPETGPLALLDAADTTPAAASVRATESAGAVVVDTVGSGGGGGLRYVTPDEQQELNPPLPPCPDTSFRFSLGASWAGLLVEKWPHGWEAVTLVEMWAIPTRRLRMEFNGCGKAVQNAILAAARQAQRDALGLAAVVVAKLPPMKLYLPPEGTATVARGGDDHGSAPSSSRSRHDSRRPPQPPRSNTRRPHSSHMGSGVGMETSWGETRAAPRVLSRHDSTADPSQHSSTACRSIRTTAAVTRWSSRQSGRHRTRGRDKDDVAPRPQPHAAPIATTSAPSTIRVSTRPTRRPVRAPLATLRPHVGVAASTPRSGRPSDAATAAAPVSDALWAIRVAASYKGEFQERELALNHIVRDPAPLPVLPSPRPKPYVRVFDRTRRRKGGPEQARPVTAAGWPVTAPVERRWFREVTSQGGRHRHSLHTHEGTGWWTSEEQAHGHVLEGQTSFFAAALVARKRQMGDATLHGTGTNTAVSLPQLSSRTGEGGVAMAQDGLGGATRVPTALPKRHAIPI